MKGKIKFFNTKKGFGFIEGEDGKEYFVHHSVLQLSLENLPVEFNPIKAEKGQQAIDIRLR